MPRNNNINKNRRYTYAASHWLVNAFTIIKRFTDVLRRPVFHRLVPVQRRPMCARDARCRRFSVTNLRRGAVGGGGHDTGDGTLFVLDASACFPRARYTRVRRCQPSCGHLVSVGGDGKLLLLIIIIIIPVNARRRLFENAQFLNFYRIFFCGRRGFCSYYFYTGSGIGCLNVNFFFNLYIFRYYLFIWVLFFQIARLKILIPNKY